MKIGYVGKSSYLQMWDYIIIGAERYAFQIRTEKRLISFFMKTLGKQLTLVKSLVTVNPMFQQPD